MADSETIDRLRSAYLDWLTLDSEEANGGPLDVSLARETHLAVRHAERFVEDRQERDACYLYASDAFDVAQGRFTDV